MDRANGRCPHEKSSPSKGTIMVTRWWRRAPSSEPRASDGEVWRQCAFLRDTLRNGRVFLIVAGISVGMNLLVQGFSALHVHMIIVVSIEVLEYLVFVADVLWFSIYLVLSTAVLIRDLVRQHIRVWRTHRAKQHFQWVSGRPISRDARSSNLRGSLPRSNSSAPQTSPETFAGSGSAS